LKQTEFSLNHTAKTIGQPNFISFNQWQKVWVAEFLEKKHRSIIPGQNTLKQLRDEPRHTQTTVTDLMETFETWLRFENFDNDKSIRRKRVDMGLRKCATELREWWKKGRQGNKQLAMDLGERVGKTARGNIPVLQNTAFMIVIR
jgi:hypothetical protein